MAVHSIALANTGQLARLQVCWSGVDLPLKAPSPGYPVREMRACERTCFCEIWISQRLTTSMGGPSGSCSRQIVVVWRGPAGNRHHPGVSALRRDGTATRGAANRNGVAIQAAQTQGKDLPGTCRGGGTPGWSHLQAKSVADGRLRLPTS